MNKFEIDQKLAALPAGRFYAPPLPEGADRSREHLSFGVYSRDFFALSRVERRDFALKQSRAMARDPNADHLSIWRGLAFDWSSWDFINQDAWKPIFRRIRGSWSADIFGDEGQREMYDELPESLTVYRGCNTKMRHGHRRLSWTLDEGKAYWFARRAAIWEKYDDGMGLVYRGTLAKKDVALVFPGRDESEVVPFSAKDIRDIHTVALVNEPVPGRELLDLLTTP